MTRAVQGFNQQLERLAERVVVLLVGALLPYTAPWAARWWFVPRLLLVRRPPAVVAGTLGEPMVRHQRARICWFGIRGIGSVCYLRFAMRRGVSGALAQQLITLTRVAVAASIVVHGISGRPLMKGDVRQVTGVA